MLTRSANLGMDWHRDRCSASSAPHERRDPAVLLQHLGLIDATRQAQAKSGGNDAFPVSSDRLRRRAQARLAGGEWEPLLPEAHAGVPEVKWSPNRMRPFLCIGPCADASPGKREAEEFIEASYVAPPYSQSLSNLESACGIDEPSAAGVQGLMAHRIGDECGA